MCRFSALVVCAAACVFSAAAPAALGASSNAVRRAEVQAAESGAQVPVRKVPRGTLRRARSGIGLSVGERVLAIANALPKVRALRAEYPLSIEGAIPPLPPERDWTVSYEVPNGERPPKQIALVKIDPRSGRVLQQLTGIQLTWLLARGEPNRWGKHVNALYVWLPMCLLFIFPFLNFRRPFSLLHLDLLVLLSFSVSVAFFNHAHIHASVPLVYPPLIYLLARMLALLRRDSVHADARPLRLLVPARWLVLGLVLLVGFRIALNVTDSTVIDVGQAGPLGAQRIIDGLPLYGAWPPPHTYQDNYGPVIYETYVPLNEVFGYTADLQNEPVHHGAAILFDLLAVALLFLLGRRVRGPTLGIALAYAWVAYPFTFYALENNSNDALIATLMLAALLAATYRAKIAVATRGVFAALAGLTKFAPLAAAPVLATHGLRELPPARRPYVLALFLAGFLGTAALAFIPALSHSSLHTFYERTIESAGNRETPFSVWGLYGGLGGLQLTVRVAAVLLGFSLALIPRRPDVIGLAAACAAAIIAVQLADGYWFYFYILWFFPLVMFALLGRFGAYERLQTEESTLDRPSRRAVRA